MCREILNAVQNLQGKRFSGIFRAADMLVLNIGDDVRHFDPVLEKDDIMPEYSLHFSTQWRFVKDDSILLASRDIYIPHDPDMDENTWEYDLTGRPDHESSIFDVESRRLSDQMQGAEVVRCTVNALGDLNMEFSNGVRFESFTPSSRKDEFWRMLRCVPGRETEHFVVFDTYTTEAEQ